MGLPLCETGGKHPAYPKEYLEGTMRRDGNRSTIAFLWMLVIRAKKQMMFSCIGWRTFTLIGNGNTIGLPES